MYIARVLMFFKFLKVKKLEIKNTIMHPIFKNIIRGGTKDMYLNMKKYNKACSESKMGLWLLFDEGYGSEVEFECYFDRLGYNQATRMCDNACVNTIIKDDTVYGDTNEKGEPDSHLWFPQVINFNNPQSTIWNQLKKNDFLKIRGFIFYYDDLDSNIRKLTILNPTILEVNRNVIYNYSL